jgi:hypothetical protein
MFIFFLNNAGELHVISLRIRKKQRAGKNRRRPKYKELHPNTHHRQEANSYREIKEATTKTLTNLDTI